MILYKNSLYRVHLDNDLKGYSVINRLTSVVEDTSNKFPTAVSMAIGLESATKKLLEKYNANEDSGVQD